MEILGIDNIFFTVTNLEKAKEFYQKLGFKHKFSIPPIKAALFSIGQEVPGLMLSERSTVTPSRLWVEVKSAKDFKHACVKLGIAGTMLETATGLTFEVTDASGNIIGFADYTKKPELARK